MSTVKEALDICRYLLRVDQPAYLHGPPGVGKSDLWRQIADEEGMGFIDIRLGMLETVDLMGLPRIDDEGCTTWARPDMWPIPERDGERGIILFDEMSDANRPMQSAAYQIILNRRVGPHILPEGWYPCAAGNRREDRAAAQVISTALANRFAHVDIEADLDAWIDWAYPAQINPMIIDFLRFRPSLLHSMEGTDLRAFPTPRSWAKAAKVCDSPANLRYKLMKSLVGEGPAGEFEAFIRTYEDLPEKEDILRDPDNTKVPDDTQPGAEYALSGALSRWADRDNFDRIYRYVKRMGREFQIITVLDATKRDPDLCETSTFRRFYEENKDLQL